MPKRVLVNWRSRVAYVLLSVGIGASAAWAFGLPVVPMVGASGSVSLLRIALEQERS
jgi:membrane associated rhomboid family serine protease